LGVDLQIGALGWAHKGWTDEFYPDTLPVEWRLTYYSNEFRCVLVPAAYWTDKANTSVEQWREDVHEGFTFFLEAAPAGPTPDELRLLAERLSGQLGGVVLRMDPAALPPHRELAQNLLRLRDIASVHVDFRGELSPAYGETIARAGAGLCWRAVGTENRNGCTVGLLTAADALGDLRGLRVKIERFIAQAGVQQDLVLFFEGEPPRVRAMRDSAVIAGLLGA
jgi:hypothetical protein